MIRVDPTHLDRALQRWNQAYGQHDTTLAIDGKTMCNALDPNGHQTHVMSVVGHHSKTCYTQKKSAACQPSEIAKLAPYLDVAVCADARAFLGEMQRQPFVLVGAQWRQTIGEFSNDYYVRPQYRELLRYVDTIHDVLVLLR